MSEEKKATIVTIAKELEFEVKAIDKIGTNMSILSYLIIAEKKMNELAKTLGVKIKKDKKK